MSPKKKAALGILGASLVHGFLFTLLLGNSNGLLVATSIGAGLAVAFISYLFLFKSARAAWICFVVLVALSWLNGWLTHLNAENMRLLGG